VPTMESAPLLSCHMHMKHHDGTQHGITYAELRVDCKITHRACDLLNDRPASRMIMINCSWGWGGL